MKRFDCGSMECLPNLLSPIRKLQHPPIIFDLSGSFLLELPPIHYPEPSPHLSFRPVSASGERKKRLFHGQDQNPFCLSVLRISSPEMAWTMPGVSGVEYLCGRTGDRREDSGARPPRSGKGIRSDADHRDCGRGEGQASNRNGRVRSRPGRRNCFRFHGPGGRRSGYRQVDPSSSRP